MIEFLYPDFLSDPNEYAQAESFWANQWSYLLRRAGSEGRWESPWINTRCADGTVLRTGNPIFSAISARQRRGVRIIQHEPAGDPGEIHYWMDTFAPGEPERVDELVISLVLSRATLPDALDLLYEWVIRGRVELRREHTGQPTVVVGRSQPKMARELVPA